MGCYSVLKQHEHAHDDAIWSVCWASQIGLITGSLDTKAKVWNLQNQGGECKLSEERVFDGFSLGVVSVDVAPQSSVVAIAAMDNKIRLFDLAKPIDSCELKTLDAGPVESWKVKFSPNGKLLATGSVHGKVNLFSTNLEGETTKTQFDAGKFPYSVDFVSCCLLHFTIINSLEKRLTNSSSSVYLCSITESRWKAPSRRQCGWTY